MSYSLPDFTYLAIRQMLLSRLEAALSLYLQESSLFNQLKSRIPLHRVNNKQHIVYESAIAFQLSKAKTMAALEVAFVLADHLSNIATQQHQTKFNLNDLTAQNFNVQVLPPGWIRFQLTEPAIAAWLQHLTKGGVQARQSQRIIPAYSWAFVPASVFAVQYAHARCCSIIQLAKREGLITLQQQPFSRYGFWLAVDPNPIPWLNSFQKLHFCHPSEYALIAQLLKLLDDLYLSCVSRKTYNCEKAAVELSKAFQIFYKYCRIWGEIKLQNLSLAQARLGLILATQPLLQFLLEELGIFAPKEI